MTETKTQTTAVVVEKAYDFLLWFLPKSERFPRSFRFTVGDRAVVAGLDLLLMLVDAAYSRDKSRVLHEANLKANELRYLMRLAKDLHLLTLDSYEFAAGRLVEIGRMIGGWQKSTVRRA